MSSFSYIDTNGTVVNAPKSILNKIDTENQPIINNIKDKIIMENAVPQTLATQKRDQKIERNEKQTKQRKKIKLNIKQTRDESRVQKIKLQEQKAQALKQNKQAEQMEQTQAKQTQVKQTKQTQEPNIAEGDLHMLKKIKIPTELNDYFKANDTITETTRTTYKYDYLRLKTLLKTKGHISNLSQSKIINAIKQSDKAKRPLINIAILLFKFKNTPHKMLLSYREELFDERDNTQKTKNMKIINDANVTYDELLDTLNKATGDDYLLFYLLINYNLRNLDLIIRLALKTDKLENKDKINYIIYDFDEAELVINNYKTKDKYGTKKFIITDEKFLKILEYKITNGDDYLFNNRTGREYRPNEMGNYIKTRFKFYLPLSKLTQSTIFKIIHNKNESNNDYSALRKMSKNRGQLIDTADKQYGSIE